MRKTLHLASLDIGLGYGSLLVLFYAATEALVLFYAATEAEVKKAARSTSKYSGDDLDGIAILHAVFASNLLAIKAR